MANLSGKLDSPIFGTLGRVADELNMETYVVGGFVRDCIMHRPCVDIDIVTIGSGIELAEKVHEALGDKSSAVSVFRNFGTAMLHFTE
ncbi:MAG TPA: tRNA nucleotidyltransferase, partial [Candidatus Onthomorpha intestinigallinarum]|nr:tRNA nucleotidyltransferase [Candidatus Onthomorpha intestinigallinarum]